MSTDLPFKADVIVMGSGIAGLMAAIEAAKSGVSVCLVSTGPICSGSSFYPGTWGLGLIGPESVLDREDLENTIQTVGEGMADPLLVHTFVNGIEEGISYLEELGVKLKKAGEKSEREFIPCFDHKSRSWNGILQESAREVLTGRLKSLGVICLPKTEIVDLVMEDGEVKGVLILEPEGQIRRLDCRALVIASGGMGGLFRYRLNTDDIGGMGQYLALKAGAKLVNMEFMQMMPGFIKPAPKTIFNEKVFRYSRFQNPDGDGEVFEDWTKETLQELLEIRSGHGPFTSRLKSSAIDRRLYTLFSQDERGVRVSYRKEIWENQPEFVRTYFQWLEADKHLTVKDQVQVGIFAHASNGGILIDSKANTGIPNLYACGEVTGGMHGADRLGGLSTANGLVFGRIAGFWAGRWAHAGRLEDAGKLARAGELEDAGRLARAGRLEDAGESAHAERLSRGSEASVGRPEVCQQAGAYLEMLRSINFKAAMVIRHEDTAQAALSEIRHIMEKSRKETRFLEPGERVPYLVLRDTYRLKGLAVLSQFMMEAILLRKESRGSHFRLDYPEKDSRYNGPILCSYHNGVTATDW